jgi:hypothetical protein
MITGGPAFLTKNYQSVVPLSTGYSEGMTVRQYAAIKLRVPDSGTDWLDDMIRTSVRDWFAGQAMVGILANDSEPSPEQVPHIVASAYILADAMLKARSA